MAVLRAESSQGACWQGWTLPTAPGPGAAGLLMLGLRRGHSELASSSLGPRGTS